MTDKTKEPVATNKKAYRDFFLTETFECGIELKGAEVKSIRAGQVNFKDAFARLEGGEVYLYNLHIASYEQAGPFSLDQDRMRKLLLKKKEIKKIFGFTTQKGLTLIPTKIYFNRRGFAKVQIALARGKKLYDKRETIKKRTAERSLKRMMHTKQKR